MTGEWLGLLTIALVCGLAVAIVVAATWSEGRRGEMDAGGGGPPAQLQFRQRRRAAGAETTVGTSDDALEDWLRRLEGKIDALTDRLASLMPRVAVLETGMQSLQQAPARFRAWSGWLIGLVAAGVGCLGCLGGLGTIVSAVAAVIALTR